MNHKLTQKQETFALKYVECGNASEAYRHAYNASKMKMETINRNAFELLQDSKIAARVEELNAEHRARHDITVDDITDELKKVIKKADDKDDLSNHRGGAMDLAKLHGHLVERQHITADIQINHKRGAIAERFAKRLLGKDDQA